MKLISFSTVLCNLQTILARILQAKDVHVSGQIPFQGNFILKQVMFFNLGCYFQSVQDRERLDTSYQTCSLIYVKTIKGDLQQSLR